MQFLCCKQLCDCKILSFRMQNMGCSTVAWLQMDGIIDSSFSNSLCHAVNFLQSSTTTAAQLDTFAQPSLARL